MPVNYTRVTTGGVDGLAIVSTAAQALPNDKGKYSDQIATAIINNVKDGSPFPGNYLPNPRLNGSDDIYFTTWPDGGYRIYVNPNIPVSADTTVGDKNFNVTYKYSQVPIPTPKEVNAAKVEAQIEQPAVVSANLPSDVPVDPGSNNMMMYLIIVVVLLVLGGGAFFVFGKKKGSTNSQSFGRMISRISRMGRSIRKM